MCVKAITVILLTSACCFVVCNSCKKNKNKEELAVSKTLFFDVNNADTLLCKAVEKIDFLALESTDESDIYNVDKMIIRNGLIYLGDFTAEKIVVYDMDGKVNFVLDEKGQGPKEYVGLKSFTVDDKSIYVLDNYRHVINTYDCYTGEYQATKNIMFVAWDFEFIADNHFIFSFIPFKNGASNREQERYKVWTTDSDFSIKRQYFPYEANESEFMGHNGVYFTPVKNGVAFSSLSSDYYTIFYPDDSLEYVKIDFANKIPDELRSETHKILEGTYNFLPSTPLFCKNYVLFEISVDDTFMDYLYNEATETFSGNAPINSYHFLLHPVTTTDIQFVSYLNDPILYKELVDSGFMRMSLEQEDHLIENEGSVLVFYTMR